MKSPFYTVVHQKPACMWERVGVCPARSAGPSFGVALDPVEPCAQHMKRESAGKPGSVVGNHSSGIHVTVDLKRPTRKRARIGAALSHRPFGPALSATSLFGLAPGGVYRAVLVTESAVRSYRTVSPLPDLLRGLRRFALCCTFRGLAPPRRYLAPDPPEPGLSSILLREQRLPGRLPSGTLPRAGVTLRAYAASSTPRCAMPPSTGRQSRPPCQAATPSPTTQPYVSTSVNQQY